MTGKPSLRACFRALSSLVAMPPGGCLMSSLVRISYHLSLSSASSMLLGWVPQMLTLPLPKQQRAMLGCPCIHIDDIVESLALTTPQMLSLKMPTHETATLDCPCPNCPLVDDLALNSVVCAVQFAFIENRIGTKLSPSCEACKCSADATAVS